MPKQQVSGERHWYAIHTYPASEDTVAQNLKQRIESLDVGNKIFNVLVPKEKKIKIKHPSFTCSTVLKKGRSFHPMEIIN